MKYQMISKSGEGAQLLYNIQEEGNDCHLYIQDKDYRKNWRGLLKNGPIESAWIDDDTIFIFDISSMGKLADSLKKEGHYVFGGSQWADNIEHDRQFGLDLMKKCNILVPESLNFSHGEFKRACDYLKKEHERRFVFKPSGDDLPSKLTYTGADSEDLIEYLHFVEKQYGKHITEFVLQEFVEGKIISTEFWCDGSQFIDPANHTVEVKKLMNNDLGPSTGCSGNAIWLDWEIDMISTQGILQLEDECIKEDYVGPIDLNTIVNEKGIYGLEWTPRFGYDAMPTFLQLVKSPGKLIADVCKGQINEMDLRDNIAAGVRLSIPPYPLEPQHLHDMNRVGPNYGIPIRGFEDAKNARLYFYEIASEDEKLIHAQGTGSILVASDYGTSIKDALDEPYQILENAKIPDKQYRTDLVELLTEMRNDVIKFQ